MPDPPLLGDGVLNERVELFGGWSSDLDVSSPQLPQFLVDRMRTRLWDVMDGRSQDQVHPEGLGHSIHLNIELGQARQAVVGDSTVLMAFHMLSLPLKGIVGGG